MDEFAWVTFANAGRGGRIVATAITLLALNGGASARPQTISSFESSIGQPTVESEIFSLPSPHLQFQQVESSAIDHPTRAAAGSSVLIASLVDPAMLRIITVVRIGSRFGP